ncbi:MAG: hypothetical protein BGO98_32165 [Myxococcales bacterium 68-20]|nr:hypothetical protein [Myxococcales bacterium]OJY18398.1 MAG: hypothetical protein BGO98_32165 [Myxococcales bacterium 68-20]
MNRPERPLPAGTTATGRWTTAQKRETDAVAAFIWTQRPSSFRWPVVVAALVLAALGADLARHAEPLGWILLSAIIMFLLFVVFVRTRLKPSLTRELLRLSVPDRSEVTATLDETGWRSSGAGRESHRAWAELDGWSIAGDDLLLIKRAKGRWIPAVIGLIPLSAFGDDNARALSLVAHRLPRIGPLNALGLRSRTANPASAEI